MFTLLFFQHFSVPEMMTNVCKMLITINEYNTNVVILTFTNSNILCEFEIFAAVKLGLLFWHMMALHQSVIRSGFFKRNFKVRLPNNTALCPR